MRARSTSNAILALALLSIAALYAAWLHTDGQPIAAWLLLVAPPLLLSPGAWLGGRLSRFWAGVLALLWFSHGVMEAWSSSDARLQALLLVLLSLVVVSAVSAPALLAKFGRRRQRGNG